MSVRPPRATAPLLAASLLLLACTDGAGPLAPGADVEPLAGRAGLACVNVDASGGAALGVILPPLEGAFNLGGLPGPFTVGDVQGTMYSYVTSGPPAPVSATGRGATLITLRHVFTAAGGSFWSDDRAVCAPVPDAPGTCRLSDQITVVGGTGIFAGATGKLHNRGTLDFNAFRLTYQMTGRVCAGG